ncbi:hypothetical protein [Arthrobacter sp. JSM 101049]|uniref:hypothetical protein n=1 Tax=Arthrobacter sp. JSM 101049 TaxID=929097 RepID=UPI0035674C74
MDGIFSHAEPVPGAGPANESAGGAEPVVAAVTVRMECDQAYEGFMDYLHLWWPLGTLSGIGPGSHLGFEGRDLVEESGSGERLRWATLRRTEAPVPVDPQALAQGLLELDFTLGHEHEAPTRVIVVFRETGTGATEVTVTHDRWSGGEAGQEQRRMAEAWPEILGYYQRFMGGAA